MKTSGTCTELPCNPGSIEVGETAKFGVVVLVLPGVSRPPIFSGEVGVSTEDLVSENNTASLETRVYYWLYLDLMVKE